MQNKIKMFLGLILTTWRYPRSLIKKLPNKLLSRYFVFGVYIITGLNLIFGQWIPFRLTTTITGTVWEYLLRLSLFGFIVGIFSNLVIVHALFWTGKKFKGMANYNQVANTFVMSLTPEIIIFAIWLIMLAFVGTYVLGPLETNTSLIITMISIPILIWQLIILVKSFSELEQISSKKSFLAVAISIFISLPFAVLIFSLSGTMLGFSI